MRTGVLICVAAMALGAQAPQAGKNGFDIRGQRQDVYFVKARNLPPGALNTAIVFAPGDGGWRGFAIEIAETMSSWGHDVYGLDTKRYLESFTTGRATLNEKQIMADMGALGRWARQGLSRRVVFVGWSEGAGLGVLALAPPENRKIYRGLALIGLPERAVMGWRWADNITYITKKEPNEPSFPTGAFLPEIAPAPVVMVQSTNDEYTPVSLAKRLFAGAREPKLLKFVDASNHRFEGNRDGLFQALRDGLAWIGQKNPD